MFMKALLQILFKGLSSLKAHQKAAINT